MDDGEMHMPVQHMFTTLVCSCPDETEGRHRPETDSRGGRKDR